MLTEIMHSLLQHDINTAGRPT